MILIDFSQTIIAGLMAQLKINDGEVSEDLLRHMIINSLRNYQKRYSEEYGEIVLCTDSSNNWRKKFFPLYKANRKKTRDASGMDWTLIFDTLHKVKMEIKDNFPYRYMAVDMAEADDIIAVLTKESKEPVLIVSGDKDFQQLHKYSYVKQWSPNLNKFVVQDDAEGFLKEHTLRGDKSDGIPNILSNDNCLAEGKYSSNDLRNLTLIDFDFIPQDIEDSVMNEYQNTTPVTGKVFDYLRTHRLDDLLNNVEDFRL